MDKVSKWSSLSRVGSLAGLSLAKWLSAFRFLPAGDTGVRRQAGDEGSDSLGALGFVGEPGALYFRELVVSIDCSCLNFRSLARLELIFLRSLGEEVLLANSGCKNGSEIEASYSLSACTRVMSKCGSV